MSKFYKIFFSVIAGFLVLLIAGAIVLSFVLADYETTVPDVIADSCFKNYIGTGNYAGLRNEGAAFEKADAINAACAERAAGKELTMAKGTKGSDDSVSYIVRAGEEKLLTFTLVKSDGKSRFGFSSYMVGKVNFHFAKDITVKAPADCTVSVNGVTLTEDFLTGEPTVDEALPMPDDLKPVAICTYQVNDLLNDPTVTAAGEAGDGRLVTYNQTGRYYEVGGEQDASLAEQYSSYVIEATERYATWMADDGWFGMVADYFEPDTATYQYIRDTEVSFVWDHDSYDFSDAKASDFHRYSDTVFTCRVKVTQNLYLRGKEPYHDYIDLTLCMHRVGNKYLVYGLKSNA